MDTHNNNPKYTACICDDVWTVGGSSGERWWPGPKVREALDSSIDPEVAVISACIAYPQLGEWVD